MKLVWLIAAAVALFTTNATAAPHRLQLVPKWQLEKAFLAREGASSERLFGVELHVPLSKATRIKPEIGAWFARSEGRNSSAYLAIQWGYQAKTPIGLFVEGYIGPSLIAVTDSRLGSHFQIKHDFGGGWMDKDGFGLGAGYTHFSDAGISGLANYGRDYFGARFIIPL